MEKRILSWKSPWIALTHDILCIPVAWFLAYWFRFNLDLIPATIFQKSVMMLPWVMISQTVAFWYFGLYRGVWRFASLPDLVRIMKAVAAGSLLSLLTLFLVFRLQGMPRAIFPMYAGLLLLGLGGPRFFYRWLKDKRAPMGQPLEKVLIVGAAHAGGSLCRDLLRKTTPYIPVAFVDDAPKDLGREIHGVRVKGSTLDIPKVVRDMGVDVIMVALPFANAKEMRRIHAICEGTRKPVHTLPGLNDLVAGKVSVKSLRKISIEDLLGRDPIRLDRALIQKNLSGKRVLISGGAGSIGSELCRQVLSYEPSELIILDHNEYHLFLIEQEFKKQGTTVPIRRVLNDICDEFALASVFRAYKPQVVFHAAAYKHVPMLEDQVRSAVRNNILGTLKVVHAAMNAQTDKFVLVSTDKAVNPTSLMGVTKRVAELICQHYADASTQFITVRFGNVLGSRGSVVETFHQQLEMGGPLTVTHPDMTRYFMTTKEACQLILQAASLGEGGEVFVLDMGEPVKIRYMAEQMIRLAGKKPNEDIQIKYTGLRPGEKLYEELFHKKEALIPTEHGKILKSKHRMIEYDLFKSYMTLLEQACEEGNESKIVQHLSSLVPEYVGSEALPDPAYLKLKTELDIA